MNRTEEQAAQRDYELEGKRLEEESKRKDKEAKERDEARERQYNETKPVDDQTQDERRAAAKVSAVEQKRLANENANAEVAKAEADRKAKLKPGQWEFEKLLEGLRVRLAEMQLNAADTSKFSATIDQLKATSGYVVEPKLDPTPYEESYRSDPTTRPDGQWK